MDPTWQILPDPLTPDVYNALTNAFVPDSARMDVNGQLGYGLLFPFRRNGKGDFAASGGVRLIRSQVALVLTTVCRSGTSSGDSETLGEIPWRTEFGSILPLVRLRNNDPSLEAAMKSYVVESLQKWISAIRVKEVIFVPGNRYKLHCKVVYDVVDAGGARVLVPGIQTAVPVG